MDASWLVPTVTATACWALSDICCDACIKDENVNEKVETSTGIIEKQLQLELGEDIENGRQKGLKLTSEQDALLSALVSLVCGLAALFVIEVTNTWANILVAVAAGSIHFTAYYSTLSAYKTASSTVITPLMQLSAVFLLVATIVANLLGIRAVPMRVHHLAAVVLIFVGGFLPAAKGDVWQLFTLAFYRQPAVRACLLGELLICCYNILLHYCTFEDQVSQTHDSVLQFFCFSRIGNFLACALRVMSTPSLQQQLRSLDVVDLKFIKIALLGESLSVVGVCIVTFAYAMFYEPAVVNAAEGGIQQLLNLCFAVIARTCSFGRKVDHPQVKFISFVLVSSGLCLSVFQ